LRRMGVLEKISERVRFTRRRFGRYEVIDFLAVLFGYAVSGEQTLEAFYERVHPFATAYMALFGRDRLPARSTLSRFLAALTPEPVEALRTLFLSDGLARPLGQEQQTGGLWDRTGSHWLVFERAWYARGGSPTGFAADLAGLCSVMRGKDYQLLDRAEVQARLHLPADGSFTRPESELVRTLYDCPDVPVGSTGQRCRVIVATHPTGKTKSRVGVERGGVAHQLVFTHPPPP